MLCYMFFFCKQKTAYEMRISDWSSDVCSSDLLEFLADDLGNHGFHGLGDLHVTLAAAGPGRHLEQLAHTRIACLVLRVAITGNGLLARAQVSHHHACRGLDRKSTRLNSSH